MYNSIVNPKAGSGKGLRIWKVIARYMDSHNIECGVFLAEGIGDARTTARRLTDSRDEPRYIIAVGRERIMNEVLDDASFHRSLSLGYVPASSGSGLAGSLHIPGRTIKCLKKQLVPRYFIIIGCGILTYGSQEVSHRRSLVSARIELDAVVCQGTLFSRCRWCLNRSGMGELSYIFVGIHQFFKYRPGKGYILLDGIKRVEFNNILFISCHVQPSEGGDFLFAPKTDGSDGKLNTCVMSHSTGIKPIPALLSALVGRRRPKGARTYKCIEISIHTGTALPAHADGESYDLRIDIQASCIARKVRMMI